MNRMAYEKILRNPFSVIETLGIILIDAFNI